MYAKGIIRFEYKDIRFINEVIYTKGNDQVTFINEEFSNKRKE